MVGVFEQLIPSNVVEAAADMNILGVLFFCVFFGVSLSQMGNQAETLIRGIEAFNRVISAMVNSLLYISPLGIASLIAEQVASSCDLHKVWQTLGKFVLTVLVGLVLQALVVLPAVYSLVVRRNPWRVLSGFSPALITAFGTDSSSATLPVTMKCAEEALHVSPSVSQFVLPLGATVNMNGTALYEAVTVIFIAQGHGIDLSLGRTCIVASISTLAAVGAAAIPSAGLVTMLMVLQAAGLGQYSSSIAVVLAIDWLLDRLRTMVNVLGDAFGVTLVHYLTASPSETGQHEPTDGANRTEML
jgi:Na+/H+-dicarboxylate symporter